MRTPEELKPKDLLPIPCSPGNKEHFPLDGWELETHNLYGYIIWLRRRIEQLEEIINDKE